MGIIALFLSGYLFRKRIQNEKYRERRMIWGAVLLYFCFSLFLNWYLREVYGWPHGIPGSDLQKYFEGAQALKEGAKLSELLRISDSFKVVIVHLGYLAYIVFIAAIVMTPVLFTMEISLQVFYCIQGFAAVAAALNIADFFDDNKNTRVRNRVFWMLLFCTSNLQMSSVLMRDIWILYFISCLMRECKKENSSLIKCIVYTFVCFVSRYYTLAITGPILVGYKYKKKKLAVLASLIVFGTFFVGQDLINLAAKIVGIRWFYHYNFDLYSLASYIMFPNPFSQAYNVKHMDFGYQANFGGNTEWIYYLLSCWNVFILPISAVGICSSIRDKEFEDAALWGMIIINIAMLMCLFYNAISAPRHKLLIVMSLAYFFKKGTETLKPISRIAVSFASVIGLIGIFIIA